MTELQSRFAAAYVATAGNAAEAARRAGSRAQRPREAGRQLLTNPDVQAEIQRLSAPLVEEQEITAQRVLAETARIAFTETRITERGKLAALALLFKFLNLDPQRDQGGDVNVVVQTIMQLNLPPEALRAIKAALPETQ